MRELCSRSENWRKPIIPDLEKPFIVKIYKNCQSITVCADMMWTVSDFERDP